MNETKLKETVEIAKRYYFETKTGELNNTVKDFMLIKDMFIDLASQVLKVEGFPQKRETLDYKTIFKPAEKMERATTNAVNNTIDQCKLIVARDYIHKSRLLTAKDIIPILERPNLSDTAKIIADAIINRQVEKMEKK